MYLAIFADDDRDVEVAGVEVGTYAEFEAFRASVSHHLESGRHGQRFAHLLPQPDSDGEWGISQLDQLAGELAVLHEALVTRHIAGVSDATDVDGLPLVEQLLALVEIAIGARRPIAFQ